MPAPAPQFTLLQFPPPNQTFPNQTEVSYYRWHAKKGGVRRSAKKRPELPPGVSLRHTLTGHSADVVSVAVTRDGRRAVSASVDQTLKVWDLESGERLRTLEGHRGRVWSVALTEDGRRAVSASDDKTLKVWDLESGQALRTLEGNSGGVGSVALTRDGRRAVSGSHDGTLKVWDLESGEALRTLEGHSDAVGSVALTGDGRRAVSGSKRLDCKGLGPGDGPTSPLDRGAQA